MAIQYNDYDIEWAEGFDEILTNLGGTPPDDDEVFEYMCETKDDIAANVYYQLVLSRIESDIEEKYPDAEVSYYVNARDTKLYINGEQVYDWNDAQPLLTSLEIQVPFGTYDYEEITDKADGTYFIGVFDGKDLNEGEVKELIGEHNKEFRTDYKSVDDFNDGEEYRNLTNTEYGKGGEIYEVEYWETEEDRDMGEGNMYMLSEEEEVSKEKSIQRAKNLFSKQNFASVEVLDEDGSVVFHISTDEPKGESYAKGGYVWVEKDNIMDVEDFEEDGEVEFGSYKDMMESLDEWNEQLDTNYSTIKEFNDGEEYRRIMTIKEFEEYKKDWLKDEGYAKGGEVISIGYTLTLKPDSKIINEPYIGFYDDPTLNMSEPFERNWSINQEQYDKLKSKKPITIEGGNVSWSWKFKVTRDMVEKIEKRTMNTEEIKFAKGGTLQPKDEGVFALFRNSRETEDNSLPMISVMVGGKWKNVATDDVQAIYNVDGKGDDFEYYVNLEGVDVIEKGEDYEFTFANDEAQNKAYPKRITMFRIYRDDYAKGGMIPFSSSNLYFNSFGKDSNGNSVIKVSFPNSRAFSIQTNGDLPKTHSLKQQYSKIENLSDKDLKIVEKEVTDYVKEFGSDTQIKKLNTYAKGGKVSKYKTGITKYGKNQYAVRVDIGDKNLIPKLLYDRWDSKSEAEAFAKRLAKRNNGTYVGEDGMFAKGGKVEKKGNEMIIGGLAGILLGIFLNK